MTLATNSIAPALYANYLETAHPTEVQALRSTELYQRSIAEYDRNWQKHLPHPLWGSSLTRRRFEILTIALGSLGYSIAYDVNTADTTLQSWHVTKGAIAGTMYHNAADDAFYMLGLEVIPAFSACVFWL